MRQRIRSDEFYRSRFWEKVDKSAECWVWTRALNSQGYGVAHCRIGGLVVRSAHRAAYMMEVGPIPEGLTIDHLCRVRNCVRPDHLEAVTQAENNRRVPSRARGGGRPRLRPEDRYVTPAKSFRPYPPELWDQAKVRAAENGENVTDVLNRALAEYVKKGKR